MSFTTTSAYTDASEYTRSPSPELQYPSPLYEFSELEFSDEVSMSDVSDLEERNRSPSPLLFPLDMNAQYTPEKVFLSPLSLPLPLPTQDTPPVCGMCSIPPDICTYCTSTPQIACRSPPIPPCPSAPSPLSEEQMVARRANLQEVETPEQIWHRAAAIQSSMVGATMQFLSIPIRDAISRVASFIYNHNSELREELEPENPINSWHSQVSDETWDNTTTAVSSEDHEVFTQFTHMSVTPDTPITPPPSPANDWSSTKSQYEGQDTGSSEQGDLIIHDEHLMPLTSEIAFEDEEPALRPPTPEFDDSVNPDHLIFTGKWFRNSPVTAGAHATTFLIPDENGILINTSYIKFDVNPRLPLLSTTNGPNQPIYSCLLRPEPAHTHLRASPYSPEMRRLFHQNEPFLFWVEEALDALHDPSLHAGVYSLRHYLRLAQNTQDQIIKLMAQAGTQMAHAQEALTDLEQANAFERILEEIRWRDADNDSHMEDPSSDANKALHEVITASTRRCHQPTPSHTRRTTQSASALRKHRKIRCNKCHQRGHIKKNCPNRA